MPLTDRSCRIGSNFATLAKDLFFDGDGNLKFKPELWADIRQHIIPGFIEQVGYVPIPRIEYMDDAVDLVIENLALSGKNLFPNLIEMEARNFAKLSAYKNIKYVSPIPSDVASVLIYTQGRVPP